MSKSAHPIGIFDSGIGGLTVAHAIRKALPGESIIYFGDTAHLPYGDKSAESIRHYAARISHFLLARKCKAIIIACNTASAHAYKTVVDTCGPHIPVVNVVDPVAEYVASNYEHCDVGVIGTKGTIQSRIYTLRIEKMNPGIRVISNATPLLAPMIEEGFYNNAISQTIINNYLSKRNFEKIRAIVLGCTHYPLISKQIQNYLGSDVDIIDSTKIVAKKVKSVLNDLHIQNERSVGQFIHFYVSDRTDTFEKSARIFFKESITLEEARIWD